MREGLSPLLSPLPCSSQRPTAAVTPGIPVDACYTAGRLGPRSGFKVVPLGGVAFKVSGLPPPGVTPGCLCQRQFRAI